MPVCDSRAGLSRENPLPLTPSRKGRGDSKEAMCECRSSSGRVRGRGGLMSDTWAMPSGFPDLPPGQVQVWRLRTDRDPQAGLAVLSAEERQRADRFRTDLLRARYVAAHAALRLLLGRALDVPADRLHLRQNPWGKPELAEG